MSAEWTQFGYRNIPIPTLVLFYQMFQIYGEYFTHATIFIFFLSISHLDNFVSKHSLISVSLLLTFTRLISSTFLIFKTCFDIIVTSCLNISVTLNVLCFLHLCTSEETVVLDVSFNEYYCKLADQCAFNLACLAKVKQTDFEYFAQDDFRCRKPDIKIEVHCPYLFC